MFIFSEFSQSLRIKVMKYTIMILQWLFTNTSNLYWWLDIPSGPRPPHCWGFKITLRQSTLYRTTPDEWSARHSILYVNDTPHSQQRGIYAAGGILTHNRSKRAAADPRYRPRGQRDWRIKAYSNLNIQSRNNWYACSFIRHEYKKKADKTLHVTTYDSFLLYVGVQRTILLKPH